MRIAPETLEKLEVWNATRHEMRGTQEEIKVLEERIICLKEQMSDVVMNLENTLFSLDQPFGIKIDDEYIIVIHDTATDHFVIQIVDFNMRNS